MSEFRQIYRTSFSYSAPFKDELGFSWHFAAFQGLNTAEAKLISQSYTKSPIRSLQNFTTLDLHPSLTNLKKVLYKETISYSEQSVWQGVDDNGKEITVFVEILEGKDTPLSRRCTQFKTLVSLYGKHPSILSLFCKAFYDHWIRESLVGTHSSWLEELNSAGGMAIVHAVLDQLAEFVYWVKRGQELSLPISSVI
ncbi:uncharacterized protein L3040_002099 [Drepanopeziza brunnea f. sp. 'multigermtubi']|uniref:Uncharacterized protein n=1 Tax=Marssonina brunnea f. sp. multigermtubi (strain MB_m1) TaxID=1072389 RepID=K1Y0Q2_MARBU|nr:uncharacterized protein MBM_02916 [Drepanopeziza brunnea f. sp. 'multigermtubi' MB_m1]EKD18674.1 hypothetical protein MBM_02916 [Drepanopeziza brunnea f. sp. 'multigermtubi' MB_m1]KAJ5052348.1 hypothetical protein L3040_002099 [Drepanopeziza brunnea f. sp. 'multigermtubi']